MKGCSVDELQSPIRWHSVTPFSNIALRELLALPSRNFSFRSVYKKATAHLISDVTSESCAIILENYVTSRYQRRYTLQEFITELDFVIQDSVVVRTRLGLFLETWSARLLTMSIGTGDTFFFSVIVTRNCSPWIVSFSYCKYERFASESFFTSCSRLIAFMSLSVSMRAERRRTLAAEDKSRRSIIISKARSLTRMRWTEE